MCIRDRDIDFAVALDLNEFAELERRLRRDGWIQFANRELALFYADQGIKLPEALELARRELEVRHDIYTWDALAWVLFKNGRFQQAAEAINKALALHTNDSLLLFHAGMIYHSLTEDSETEGFLGRALRTNPNFHVLNAETARRTLEEIAPSSNRDLRSSNAQR